MQALVVEFRIKPEFADDFATLIADNARASRQTEPGCVQFDVCRDPSDETVFFLYELYVDDAAIEAHLKSAHFLHMNAASSSWIDTKVVRKLSRTHP